MSEPAPAPRDKHLIIMGIRGIPGNHGGFETFAGRLAPYLVEQGWKVTVYCQGSATGRRETDVWNGVRRIHLPVAGKGATGSIVFDIKATLDVLGLPGTILTLGYNTGFLCCLLAARGRTNIVNMDGIEWKRAKYGRLARTYLWINERLAAWSGTRLIADHPAIADHLATRVARGRISMIPYGAPGITDADPALLADYGLEPRRFLTVIARAEPENSVLELVRAFSARPRGVKLAVLGRYSRDHPFQRGVLNAASAEVLFLGPVYAEAPLRALRFFSIAYLHGHQVGGTNPSLVEALGGGNAIIAHDNPFNRWVAGEAALYFSNESEIDAHVAALTETPERPLPFAQAARRRWREAFTWPDILARYQACLEGMP